jgi:hypothetical protein
MKKEVKKMIMNNQIKETNDGGHSFLSKLFRRFNYTIPLPVHKPKDAQSVKTRKANKQSLKDSTSNTKLDIRRLDTHPLRHFTPEMIPEPIKLWTIDNCAHAEGSLNFGAVSAIIVCSNLVGMNCQVKPKCNGYWMVTPNLWGLLIGEPSKRKSPIASQFIKPLEKLEKQAKNLYKKQMAEYHKASNEQHIAQKVKNNALKKAYESGGEFELRLAKNIDIPSIEKPFMERFIFNDTTSEKVGEIMSTNPRTLLIYRDELSGLFSTFSKAGREGDRSFYLEAFNGNSPFIIDRIGRGTIHIDKLSIGIFGTIQPDILSGFITSGNGYSGDGFIQRLQLAVFPDDIKRKYYDEAVDIHAKEKAYEIIERLATENYAQLAGSELDLDGTPYFSFDDKAQERFIAWYNSTKLRVENEPDVHLQAHIGKYFGLLPALALTFFLIDKVAEVTRANAIDITYVELAIVWCEVLESHARKMYALGETQSKSKSLREKIIEYVKNNQDKLPMSFGKISQGVRGATAGDVEEALQGIADIEGKQVKKLLTK